MDKNAFIADLHQRVRDTRPSRWVRFGIVSLIFFLWVAWLGNWWVALLWILLFDFFHHVKGIYPVM